MDDPADGKPTIYVYYVHFSSIKNNCLEFFLLTVMFQISEKTFKFNIFEKVRVFFWF